TTMHDNVAYGRPDAEQDSIEDVSRLAQFHEYAASLPEGYETVVGERGNSLSGGQRQRLAIARSLLMDPAVIVFDDSTASIDAATEERIRRALADITKNKTKIVISHRLSSLMHADEILVLDRGQVAERGTHEELIAAGGRYRDLYELQLRPALDGNGREGLQTLPLKTGSQGTGSHG
ncbi:MAG: ATP-binding cassette domain-containing protein, partial [Chloroflexi bacterium]|nr:ATP-binding cassette domain-containing protein [Chloroflexota bacterium]